MRLRSTQRPSRAGPRTFRVEHGGLTAVVTRHPGDAGADARPFVLVHGIGVSSRYFRPLTAALRRHGPVYEVDLPGYGAAPAPPGGNPGLEEHCAMLTALVERGGLKRPLLIGHSMGTQVVTMLAATRPELTDRIALIGTTMRPDSRAPLKASALLALDMLREPPKPNLVVLTDYLFRCGIPYYLRQLPNLLADRIEDRLPMVRARALVISGDRDRIAPAAWSQRVAALLQQGRFEQVPGPHIVMFSAPERVAELLARHAA